MDLRKSWRLAGVLVASQMRVGRAGTDPKSFFGRPISLLFANCVAFAIFLLGAVAAGEVLAQAAPGDPATLLAEYLPFVPLAGVGAVLVGGMMFELATTVKFATSDAVYWLPIRSDEYVVGSSFALVALYFLALSVLSGIALGLGLVAGQLGLALFAVLLGVVGLFEGALFIEIVRAVSQRAGAVGPKRGSAALVVRGAVFLLVILAFEVGFNPVLLLTVVHAVSGLGPLGLAIPFLWPSDAVAAAATGNGLGSLAAVAADLGFVVAVALTAAEVRRRYWVPAGGELRFDAHEFGRQGRTLGILGFTPAEAALVGKDLRGLVRRRELLPQLLVPFAVGVVLLVSRGGGQSADVITFGILAWASGLSALLMAASSFGQERRAVVHLYSLPLAPNSVLKAKATAALLVSLLASFVLAGVGIALHRPPLPALPATVLAFVVSVVVGTMVGLVFGTRYADFQERPRPQFIRPLPMLGAFGLYAVLGGGAAGATLLIGYGTFGPLTTLSALVVAGLVLAGVIAGLAALARSGVRSLLRQLPA